jgi:hypothetical protein
MMELSILIATVSPRHSLLSRLLDNLGAQLLFHDPALVEVVVHRSDTKTKGQKFNELYAAASGRLAVQVDDDDQVSQDFLTQVLDHSFGYDFVGYKVKVTYYGMKPGSEVLFHPELYRHPASVPENLRDQIHFLTPKCPVLTTRAQQFAFNNEYVFEDRAWTTNIVQDGFPFKPVFIDRVLYHYDCWPSRSLNGPAETWPEQRQVQSRPYDHRQFTWLD